MRAVGEIFLRNKTSEQPERKDQELRLMLIIEIDGSSAGTIIEEGEGKSD